MSTQSTCPECNGKRVYRRSGISAGGGYAPNYLGGLATFWKTPKFTVAVCADCGLTRFYASADARARLADHNNWHRG